MYIWDVLVTTRNGEKINGVVKVDKNNSADVFMGLIVGENGQAASWFGVLNLDQTATIYICVSEIVSIKIGPR